MVARASSTRGANAVEYIFLLVAILIAIAGTFRFLGAQSGKGTARARDCLDGTCEGGGGGAVASGGAEATGASAAAPAAAGTTAQAATADGVVTKEATAVQSADGTKKFATAKYEQAETKVTVSVAGADMTGKALGGTTNAKILAGSASAEIGGVSASGRVAEASVKYEPGGVTVETKGQALGGDATAGVKTKDGIGLKLGASAYVVKGEVSAGAMDPKKSGEMKVTLGASAASLGAKFGLVVGDSDGDGRPEIEISGGLAVGVGISGSVRAELPYKVSGLFKR